MHEQYFTMTVPYYIRTLTALKGVLAKGKQFAEEKGVKEEVFLQHRLAYDMFDLTKQVQVACDNAKLSTARLTEVDAPRFSDDEKTFDELEKRIDMTIEYLRSITPEHFKGAKDRHIVLPYFPGKHFVGHEYIAAYAVPNFFFHVVTAYDILRHLGVPVGKADYLGPLPLHDD